MVLNYIKVAIRNVLKHKTFSFINVFGLAAAMSVCMLIIAMLADQKQYDQFHRNKERIYRVLSKAADSSRPYASTPFPLAATLISDYPVIEDATHLVMGVGGEVTYNGETAELRGFFADTSFFDVFSYRMEKGNGNTALTLPNSMIITSDLAYLLFTNEDPIGKIVQFTDRGFHYLKKEKESPPTTWGSYTITGVIDMKCCKSHLKFDALVSASSMPVLQQENKIGNLANNWLNFSKCFTYLLLRPDAGEPELDAALADLTNRNYSHIQEFKEFRFVQQPLTSISPGIWVNQPASIQLPLEAYYVLSFLTLIILFSACLNYTNLCTARALTRAKEIGVRKVAGARKKDLIYQFLCESILITFLALAVAILLLLIIKPAFRGLWLNSYLKFDLNGSAFVYVVFAGLAAIVGILAGAYPAFHLASYQPTRALKNADGSRRAKLSIRKILMVFQFVISSFFLVTSIAIYKQLSHYRHFSYGFEPQGIVNIQLQGNDYQSVVNLFSSAPGVVDISGTEYMPATGTSKGTGLRRVGVEEEYKDFRTLTADSHFIDNMQIPLVAGKNFSGTMTDSLDRFVIISEAGVKALGYSDPSDVLGRQLEVDGSKEFLVVVGVVGDFRIRMPIEEDRVGPVMLRNSPRNLNYLNVKLSSTDVVASIGMLEDKWKTIDVDHPFEYEFYDDQLAATNKVWRDAVLIIGFLAFLSIMIACLGLLGMATYAVERRIKEVGIRRVLGAGDWDVTFLLSKQFLNLLLFSLVIGSPLSFAVNNWWLQRLPNRVDFSISTVLLGSFILLLFGLITVGSQTLALSNRKLLDCLRME